MLLIYQRLMDCQGIFLFILDLCASVTRRIIVGNVHHHLVNVLMQFDADAFNFRIGVIVPE